MDIISTGMASLNLLFMTTEERIASDASHILKKLINYILDHQDNKQAPPSIQDLQNNAFACGFQAGHRKVYQQWGVEVEERMDEAYNGGIADKHKWWKGKQTNTEPVQPCNAPTPTTTTIETAMQTNTHPKCQCAAIQTESTTREMVYLSTQMTTMTISTATETTPCDEITPTTPSLSPPAGTPPLTMHTQLPSITSTLPSMMPTLLAMAISTPPPASEQPPGPPE
jgi:hypothetical protein